METDNSCWTDNKHIDSPETANSRCAVVDRKKEAPVRSKVRNQGNVIDELA